ncbi:MAG: tetratricopeptide repeat protein [Candidatus Omnitrophica bacterium]|nr:tetratricopeptide repeat protein [Candidatus Omnitrophota bacterium]
MKSVWTLIKTKTVDGIRILTVVFAGLLISLGAFFYHATAAPDDVQEEIKRGIYQFRQENFDEALEILSAARQSYPDNPLAAYYLGLTYKRMEDYVNARKELEASLEMTPKIKGALIELIDVLYRLGQLEDAKKWIRVAETEGIRPAQAAFLKGLTLLKDEQYDEAIESFRNAKGLDETLAQPSNYHIGIAYLKQQKFDKARQAFDQIVSISPDTDIAAYANKYIEAIDRKAEGQRPFHFSARFAFEYDDNVVLKPGNTSLVSEVGEESDTREVYDFTTDYTLREQNSPWSLKSGYGLRFSKQNDLGRYDYLTNAILLQPSWGSGRLMSSLPARYTHNIVDGKNYVQSVSVSSVNNYLVTPSHMAQAGVTYQYDDYMRPPYGEESRTGNEFTGTLAWYWFFLNNQGFLNLRYSAGKDWTHGNNWENFGNRFSLGWLVPFWKRFKASANAEFYTQEYDHTHSFFFQQRRDKTYSLSSLLSYEFLKNTELQFQYTYINSQSNVSIYDYSRHVLSSAVQYKF